MIAAATGFSVVRMKGGETGPAYGAARLARLVATGEAPEAVCTPPEVADVTEPDPALADAFAAQRARFTALYAAVKGSSDGELRTARTRPTPSPTDAVHEV